MPFRAIFADGLTVAVMDGVATAAQLVELERRFVAFLRAIARGDRRRWGPGRDRGGAARRAERGFVGMAVSRADADFARYAAARGGRHADRSRQDDRRCRPAPRARPARPGGAARLDGAQPHRRAGARGRRGRHEPGLVRRAAAARTPWSRACTTRASARARPGRSPTWSASCSRCRGRRRCAARRRSPRPGSSRRGCRWRRPGWRSASTPGRASSTSTATSSARSSPGRSGSTRSMRREAAARVERAGSRRVCADRRRGGRLPDRRTAAASPRASAKADRDGQARSRATPARDGAEAPSRLAEQDPPKQ